MVVIRLARRGAKKRPFYDVVVADSRRSRDGRYIARVGYFNPVARGQETRLQIEKDAVNQWISKGAIASDRVAKLLKDFDKGLTQARPIAKPEPKKTKVEAKVEEKAPEEKPVEKTEAKAEQPKAEAKPAETKAEEPKAAEEGK